MHKKCNGIRCKLKEKSNFKNQTCANQQTGITKDFLVSLLNGLSLEFAEKVRYLGDAIGDRRNLINKIILLMRSG